jgi:glycosyltransferase involved in cell wall biosynthesis
MKALIFAPAFAPYMGSESLTASKLAIALRRSGWDIDVISRGGQDLYSNEWTHPWNELATCTYPLSTKNPGYLEILKERFRDTWHFKHPLPGLRWASLAEDLGRRMHLSKRYDVILSRSPPDIGHLPAMVLAKKFGLPWIANWNDPPVGAWPEPYAAENGSKITQEVYRRYVRHAYSMASLNTFPSIELACHVQQHFNLEEMSYSMVIPHASLDIPHYPLDSAAGFVLTHAGKMTDARSPISLLEGIQRFIATVAPAPGEFTLQIIGHADSNFRILADRYGVSQYLQNTGVLPFSDTMETLSSSTINVLVEAPCSEGIFLPGKLSDYAQAGRPILAVSPSVGVARRLLGKHGGGLHADVNSSAAIHQALVSLHDDWQNDRLEKRYSTTALAAEFSAASITKAYEVACEQAFSAHKKTR